MFKPLQDRERGLHGSPLAFNKAAYVAALPTMRMECSLRHHNACVNHISFSESGDTLLSGSDDVVLGVWDVERRRLRASLRTGHHANIFCVKYMPATGDKVAVSCAGDSEVRVHDLTAGPAMEVYTHHHDRVKKLVTETGNPWLILSAAEDGTVRQLDRRQPQGGPAVLAYVRSHGSNRMIELNSICSPAQRPHLFAVGGGDPWLRVYDRRMTSSIGRAKVVAMYSPAVGNPSYLHDTITGVACSADGRWIIGNYLNDAVYLFALNGDRAPESAAEPPTAVGRPPVQRFRRSMRAEGTEERDEGIALAAEGRLDDIIDVQLEAQRSRMPGQSSRERAEVLAARAGRFRREGRVQEAMVCAAAALRLSPRLGRAFFELAACHEASGNYDAALRDAELAKGLCWSQELEDLEGRLRAHFAEQNARGAVVAAHRAALAEGSEDDEARGISPDLSMELDELREGRIQAFSGELERGEAEGSFRPPRPPRQEPAEAAEPSSSAAADADGETSGGGSLSVGEEVWIDEEIARAITPEPAGSEEGMSESSDELSDESSVSSMESEEEGNALENYLAADWPFADLPDPPEVDDIEDNSHKVWGTDCESDDDPVARLPGTLTPLANRGQGIIDGEPPRDPPSAADGVEQGHVMRYRGHINQQTIKDVAFVGPDDCAVAAGSDCSRLFLWDRATGRLLTAVRSDTHIVNCVASHPHEPLLAACGLDSSIKLWAPHYGVHRMALQRHHLAIIAGNNEQKSMSHYM
ncbi:hypothetical protein WJX75_009241 [Coccomyxa subellipsoidea]|uniref:WD40 repeat-like protein n=1 Tax=Coccomyxa subellipsoidea TaxID=248742 RepID=A0ABR2YEK4_9CHLO